MDWLDLLAVQGTLKSLLQHHSSKASILRCSDFFKQIVYRQYLSKCQQELSKRLSRVFSSTTVQKHQFFALNLLYGPTLTSIHTGKTTALTIWTFVGKVMSQIFNMLSRFIIAFLPRSKCLLIAWLQSPSTLTLEPKMKSDSFHIFPIYLP